MQKLLQGVVCSGCLGFFTLLGCGVDTAAVAVIGTAAAGSAVASTAQVDNNNNMTSGGNSSGDLSSLDGIYHVSAMAAETISRDMSVVVYRIGSKRTVQPARSPEDFSSL